MTRHEWQRAQSPDAEGWFDPAVFLTIALGIVLAAWLVTAY